MKILERYRVKLIILSNQGVVSGMSFFLSIFLVRLLGVQVFGEFALILLITQGIVAINQSLVTSPYQSLYAQSTLKKYSRELKGIQLVIIGVLLIALFIFESSVIIFEINLLSLPTVLFSMYLIGTILSDFNRKQLYLHKKYFLCFFKDLFSTISQLSLMALFVYFDEFNSLKDILLSIGSGLLLVEVLLFFLFKPPLKPRLSLIKTHWNFGKWMVGNSILQWFSGNFYITTGALLMGAKVVGIIRIGQSIIGVLSVFIQVLENYVPPIAALIYRENGIKSLKTYIIDLILKGGLAISFASFLLIVFKDMIWQTIYGIEFLDYSYILFWFAPILCFNFLGVPLRFAIRTLDKTRILFEAYLISCFLGFTTAHLFISSLGIHGICLGLLLTQVIMQVWYSFRLLNINQHESNSYSTR